MFSKHLRREVYGLQVCCWYKERGCQWKGELSYLRKHALSCLFRYYVSFLDVFHYIIGFLFTRELKNVKQVCWLEAPM